VLVLVLSDLHLGRGKFLTNGQINILEDFEEDDRFVEFLEFYRTGKFYWTEVHLVLNGDILNTIQIDIDGIFSHIIDEDHAFAALELIHQGHPQFFEALKSFVAAPNKKISYIIGNHDASMAFEKAQKRFSALVGAPVKFSFDMNLNGIHIEHGHRFEVINTVAPDKYFLQGPLKKKILNLPWGSLFCIMVLPSLKKERQFIDRVRPVSTYIKWTLIHDFIFFLRMTLTVMKYLIMTNFDIYIRQNRNFKTTLKVLKQITIYPKYERKAKAILRANTGLHTVVMGHTHVVEWRRFPEGKYYFNSGTWNSIPSMDAGMHASHTRLTFVAIDINSKTGVVRNAGLNVWQGQWRPFREEASGDYNRLRS
jgi:UDP-2,3-diacylglucosamine pyrophosphatase LpxH